MSKRKEMNEKWEARQEHLCMCEYGLEAGPGKAGARPLPAVPGRDGVTAQ